MSDSPPSPYDEIWTYNFFLLSVYLLSNGQGLYPVCRIYSFLSFFFFLLFYLWQSALTRIQTTCARAENLRPRKLWRSCPSTDASHPCVIFARLYKVPTCHLRDSRSPPPDCQSVSQSYGGVESRRVRLYTWDSLTLITTVQASVVYFKKEKKEQNNL